MGQTRLDFSVKMLPNDAAMMAGIDGGMAAGRRVRRRGSRLRPRPRAVVKVKVAEAADFASDSDCRHLPRVLRGVDFQFPYFKSCGGDNRESSTVSRS